MSQIEARFLRRFWLNEVPTGAVNGSNTSFTISQIPIEQDSLIIYINGLVQKPTTDYTFSGTTITMTYAPATGSSIWVEYVQKTGGT